MSDITEYDVGMLIESTMRFRNRTSGALVDPDEVEFRVRRPDETEDVPLVHGTDPEVIKDAVGVYRCAVLLDMHGIFKCRWNGTDGDLGTGGSVSSEREVRGAQSSFDDPLG